MAALLSRLAMAVVETVVSIYCSGEENLKALENILKLPANYYPPPPYSKEILENSLAGLYQSSLSTRIIQSDLRV